MHVIVFCLNFETSMSMIVHLSGNLELRWVRMIADTVTVSFRTTDYRVGFPTETELE